MVPETEGVRLPRPVAKQAPVPPPPSAARPATAGEEPTPPMPVAPALAEVPPLMRPAEVTAAVLPDDLAFLLEDGIGEVEEAGRLPRTAITAIDVVDMRDVPRAGAGPGDDRAVAARVPRTSLEERGRGRRGPVRVPVTVARVAGRPEAPRGQPRLMPLFDWLAAVRSRPGLQPGEGASGEARALRSVRSTGSGTRLARVRDRRGARAAVGVSRGARGCRRRRSSHGVGGSRRTTRSGRSRVGSSPIPSSPRRIPGGPDPRRSRRDRCSPQTPVGRHRSDPSRRDRPRSLNR